MEKEKMNVMYSMDITYRRTSQISDPVLSCENLSRQVSGNWIWSNITIYLNPGARLALTEFSGSGISLLLRTLDGLDAIDDEHTKGNGEKTLREKPCMNGIWLNTGPKPDTFLRIPLFLTELLKPTSNLYST